MPRRPASKDVVGDATGMAARAFVPGHITGFFTAHRHEDPDIAGSTGAGVTLSDGVTVTCQPASTTRVAIDGRPRAVEPVGRVLDALGITAEITVQTDLPIGAGFGVSGAMTLGTALAANRAFGCGLTENELIAHAHRAEVRSATGLGDVVAQARGGIPVRLAPGGPAHNELDGIPTASRIEYHSFGSLSTEAVLTGETEANTDPGTAALDRLLDAPTLPRLMRESRRFADESGLLTDRVAAAIDAVTAAGGEAAMAMLGRTVFALDTGLSDAGFPAESCTTHSAGATLVL